MRSIGGLVCVGAPNSQARADSAESCCYNCMKDFKREAYWEGAKGYCYICEQRTEQLYVLGEMIPISSIKKSPNGREHSDSRIKQTANHIQEFGLHRAIILNQDHKLVDGLLRTLAYNELKFKHIPARIVHVR